MSRKLGRSAATMVGQAASAQVNRDPLFGLSSHFPRLSELDLGQIVANPDQPRRHFDDEALLELAESLQRHGQLQPVLVRELGGNRYQLVAGERRWRAAQLAGHKTLFAILTDGDPDELALIENIQRVDLHPLEEAHGLRRLIERHNYTHEIAGQVLGRSPSEVSRLLALLALPDDLQQAYAASGSEVSRSILAEIVACEDDEQKRILWQMAIDGATVRDIRSRRRQWQDGRESTDTLAEAPSPAVEVRKEIKKITKVIDSVERLLPCRDQLTEQHREQLKDLHQRIGRLLG